MESTEIHFRLREEAESRESFLEKEMLNSDVHHLEVRTSFFDKLTVLSSGSIAVGISFLAAGFQRESGQHAIQQQFVPIVIASILIFASLSCSIAHNLFVSLAVTELSKQIESVYKAANEFANWRRTQIGVGNQSPTGASRKLIDSFNEVAKRCEVRKECTVRIANAIGISAILLLFSGYTYGLVTILMVIVSTK